MEKLRYKSATGSMYLQAFCIFFQGVLSLKKSYFEPRYILLIPTQVEKYTGRLKSRGLYTPAQIDVAVSRIKLYANASRQRPGFFDNVIPCGIERKRSLKCFFSFFLWLHGGLISFSG